VIIRQVEERGARSDGLQESDLQQGTSGCCWAINRGKWWKINHKQLLAGCRAI
jgi:hypothetical protein